MFLRNVGSHKIYTASHPRRWHSSFIRFVHPHSFVPNHALFHFSIFTSHKFHYYLIYTLLTVNNFRPIYIRSLFLLQSSMPLFRPHQNTPQQSDTCALSL
jgi:hypothetical protein